jgi:hypothetical protein
MTALTIKQKRLAAQTKIYDGSRSWTYWVTFCYVVLTPWVVVPTAYGFSLGASDLLFPIALIALTRRLGSRRSIASSMLIAFMGAAYLATAALAASTGQVEVQRFLALTRAVAVLVPFLVAVAHGPFSDHELRRLLKWLLVSGSGAIALGWLLFRLGVQIRDSQQTIWSAQGVVSLRAGGLLGNSTSFGSLAVSLAVVALALALITGRRKVVTFLFIGFCLSGIVIASSRASLLNIAVVLILLLPVFFRKRALLGGVVVLLLGAGVLLLGVAASRISSSSSVSNSLYRLDFLNLSGNSTFFQSNTRLDSWDAMIGLLDQHWLWGIGYNSTVSLVGNAGDNSFLSPVVEMGVLAGALFALFWILLGIRYSTASSSRIRWIGLAIWVGALAQMLTVDSYRQWSSTPIMMALFGILHVASSAESATVLPQVNGFLRSEGVLNVD